jgi:hypothetical protein
MPDQNAAPGATQVNAGEPRRPFVRPALEDLGTLTIVTQQTIIIIP